MTTTTTSTSPQPASGGEFDLIRRHFVRPHTWGAHVVDGPGDDCALLAHTPNTLLAVSTDLLVAGRHFFTNTDPTRLGHKSLAVNLSDLAAMGATPRSFTLSLALPALDDDWLAQFSNGLFALAAKQRCSLVGGDTTRGPLTIGITVMGEVPAQQALKRSGAQVGDVVFVSGALGEAAWALDVLNDKPVACGIREQSTPQQWQQALDRLEQPSPRNELGLAVIGIATSAIDVSDGLAGDLLHILNASGAGASINVDALPCASALSTAPADYRRQCCAAGGDDYELLMTAPPDNIALMHKAALSCGVAITPIGRIHAEAGLVWTDAFGRNLTTTFQAFDHFLPHL